jgi:hypothetical protein
LDTWQLIRDEVMYMRAISERKYAAERALHVRSGNDNVCAIGEKMSLGHKLLREHKRRGYICTSGEGLDMRKR